MGLPHAWGAYTAAGGENEPSTFPPSRSSRRHKQPRTEGSSFTWICMSAQRWCWWRVMWAGWLCACAGCVLEEMSRCRILQKWVWVCGESNASRRHALTHPLWACPTQVACRSRGSVCVCGGGSGHVHGVVNLSSGGAKFIQDIPQYFCRAPCTPPNPPRHGPTHNKQTHVLQSTHAKHQPLSS